VRASSVAAAARSVAFALPAAIESVSAARYDSSFARFFSRVAAMTSSVFFARSASSLSCCDNGFISVPFLDGMLSAGRVGQPAVRMW